MTAEDRVTAAAKATAASVRQIRPLELPEASPVSVPRRRHRAGRGSRVSGTRAKFKETWVIPLGSAAVVAALALTLVTVRHAEAPRPAPAQTGAAVPAVVAGIPRYYAVAAQGKANHNGLSALTVTVGDAYTGKALTAVTLPPVGATPGTSAVGVSAAGDDRTFVAGRRSDAGGITYFLVHITPGAKKAATVRQLPIPQLAVGVPGGFAVSPNGKELAALSVRGNGTTLRIYSVQSGATLRTWVAGSWRSTYSLYQEGVNVSWTADNRQVAFSNVVVVTAGENSAPSSLQERVVGATVPSGNLATASKIVLAAPGSCMSLLLTPDGGTVVCGTVANYPSASSSAGCGTNPPVFIAYSAATGKRLRVLYQYPGTCYSTRNIVLWADDSARHVLGENLVTVRENPGPDTDRYGVAVAGGFAKFTVLGLSQSSAGPAF
ncbi:MAG TPA: hypothetical protein VGD91_03625 [Trebonia sp.]